MTESESVALPLGDAAILPYIVRLADATIIIADSFAFVNRNFGKILFLCVFSQKKFKFLKIVIPLYLCFYANNLINS